jgi:hypothetical protein
MIAEWSKTDGSKLAELRVRWNLESLRKKNDDLDNTILRIMGPNSDVTCSDCDKFEITSKSGTQVVKNVDMSESLGGVGGQVCYEARLSNGKNEFGKSKGSYSKSMTCTTFAEDHEIGDAITGKHKACLCGNVASGLASKQCPAATYQRDCCPEGSKDCMGLTGRKPNPDQCIKDKWKKWNWKYGCESKTLKYCKSKTYAPQITECCGKDACTTYLAKHSKDEESDSEDE